MLNKPLKIGLKTLQISRSGEILPNVVTLLSAVKSRSNLNLGAKKNFRFKSFVGDLMYLSARRYMFRTLCFAAPRPKGQLQNNMHLEDLD